MSNLSNMPWEDRPVGSKEVVWRYSANPIIPRDLLPTSNSIFNSAVVPFGDSYAGVFRCDDTNRRMRLHVGFSKDAVHWDIHPEPLTFECDNAEVVHGLFSTSGPSDSVMMVTLYMNDEAIMPLVLENGKVEVSISNSQLTAKGTPLNNALYEFIEKRNALELKIEELEKKEARMVLDGAALEDRKSTL